MTSDLQDMPDGLPTADPTGSLSRGAEPAQVWADDKQDGHLRSPVLTKGTTKFYDPSDPRSSRYEPVIGHLVLYRPPRNSAVGKDLIPAVITRVLGTEDDRVNLTVFSDTGTYHVSRVRFSGDPSDDNCWFWPEPKVTRAIQTRAEEPVS